MYNALPCHVCLSQVVRIHHINRCSGSIREFTDLPSKTLGHIDGSSEKSFEVGMGSMGRKECSPYLTIKSVALSANEDSSHRMPSGSILSSELTMVR